MIRHPQTEIDVNSLCHQPITEMSFNIVGTRLPIDNGYPLYASLCTTLDKRLPPDVGMHSVGGINDGKTVFLDRNSKLRFRTNLSNLPFLSQFTGKSLSVEGYKIRLGTFNIYQIQPSPTLYSRLTTFSKVMDESSFLQHVHATLDFLQVKADPILPCNLQGDFVGSTQRRIVTIKNNKIVGFGLKLDNLSDEDSMKIIHTGLGGRRHMGCGIFSPVRD